MRDTIVLLTEAVAVLRASDRPGARHVADALGMWLHTGGDVRRHLGILGTRGGRYRTPQESARLAERARLLHAAAEALPAGPIERKAKLLAAAINGESPRLPSAAAEALVHVMALGLPRSADRLARILRETSRGGKPASYAILDRFCRPR